MSHDADVRRCKLWDCRNFQCLQTFMLTDPGRPVPSSPSPHRCPPSLRTGALRYAPCARVAVRADRRACLPLSVCGSLHRCPSPCPRPRRCPPLSIPLCPLPLWKRPSVHNGRRLRLAGDEHRRRRRHARRSGQEATAVRRRAAVTRRSTQSKSATSLRETISFRAENAFSGTSSRSGSASPSSQAICLCARSSSTRSS